MFQVVSFSLGSYNATLKPKWWNSTSSVNLQFKIVETRALAFLTTLPLVLSGTVSSSDLNVTQVNNLNMKGRSRLSKGIVAAAVLVLLIIIGLALTAYIKYTCTCKATKHKRWSEAVDKCMLVMSADWRSVSVKGAEADIWVSMADPNGNSVWSGSGTAGIGIPRPSSTFMTEGAQSEGDIAQPEMAQICHPDIGLHGPIASATGSATCVSHVLFTADASHMHPLEMGPARGIVIYDCGSDRGNRRIAFDDNKEDHMTMGFHNKWPLKDRPVRSMPGESMTFRNRMTCLPGFVVYKKPLVDEIWFPPPKVPEGWTPDPCRVWVLDKENMKTTLQDEVKMEPLKDAQGRRWILLTHDQHGNLLGETPLPAAPHLVFDYLSAKDHNCLKNLTTGNAQPGSPTPTKPGHAPASPEPEAATPCLDPQVAKMALQGFQPFTADPVKQAQYTAFLQAQAAGLDDLLFRCALGQAADSFKQARLCVLSCAFHSAYIPPLPIPLHVPQYIPEAETSTGSDGEENSSSLASPVQCEGLHDPSVDGIHMHMSGMQSDNASCPPLDEVMPAPSMMHMANGSQVELLFKLALALPPSVVSPVSNVITMPPPPTEVMSPDKMMHAYVERCHAGRGTMIHCLAHLHPPHSRCPLPGQGQAQVLWGHYTHQVSLHSEMVLVLKQQWVLLQDSPGLCW
ncbi:hypothetical protein M0805_005887 [Coniferiporia weirii]|nr:hypothetical protein M0805_005887 [Coniferiporia weirii]